MPKPRLRKRPRGRALSTAALAWNLWRRLPPARRRQVLALARKHGPKLAKTAIKARRKAKRATRKH